MSQTEYVRHERVCYPVNEEYTIVFDRCNPKVDGVILEQEQLLMRYTKNGNTVNRAPAFDEMEMAKAIVELYNSKILSREAKEVLKEGIAGHIQKGN